MENPYFARNLVYGLEDSLVSTTGLVVGLSLAGMSNADVVRSGVILLLVESLSMALGSFISEDSFMMRAEVEHPWKTVIRYSTVMFVSYVAAGALTLMPFALNVPHAWQWSAGLGLVGLYALLHTYQKKTERSNAKTTLLTVFAAVIIGLSVVTGTLLKKST